MYIHSATYTHTSSSSFECGTSMLFISSIFHDVCFPFLFFHVCCRFAPSSFHLYGTKKTMLIHPGLLPFSVFCGCVLFLLLSSFLRHLDDCKLDKIWLCYEMIWWWWAHVVVLDDDDDHDKYAMIMKVKMGSAKSSFFPFFREVKRRNCTK